MPEAEPRKFIKRAHFISGKDMFVMAKDCVTFGRALSPDVDIQITGSKVSKRHARVVYDRILDEFLLVTYSKNGIVVNGEWELPRVLVLSDGDRFRIGSREFRFVRVPEEVVDPNALAAPLVVQQPVSGDADPAAAPANAEGTAVPGPAVAAPTAAAEAPPTSNADLTGSLQTSAVQLPQPQPSAPAVGDSSGAAAPAADVTATAAADTVMTETVAATAASASDAVSAPPI